MVCKGTSFDTGAEPPWQVLRFPRLFGSQIVDWKPQCSESQRCLCMGSQPACQHLGPRWQGHPNQPRACSFPKGELFQDCGCHLCFPMHLSVHALCVLWGLNKWENWATVTQPKGISSRGKNSLTNNFESCFIALGSECLESNSLLSLHRPCGGDDAT